MRILITGVTGFAGGYLASHLAQNKSAELFGADIHPRILPELKDRVALFVGDLQSPEYVTDTLKQVRPDAIYHLAGQPFVPTAWSNPWQTIQLNVLPQLNLIKGLIELEMNPRFLSVTSGKMYGLVSDELIPLKEETPFQPDNPYDLSKVTQDLMAQQYFLSHQLNIIRARPFNHIGPRQTSRFVAAAFAEQIARVEAGLSEPVIRVGNLAVARDFSDVQDIVRAYRLLVEKGRPGEAYNIGSGRAVEVQHILDVLLSLSDTEIKIEPDPSRMRPVDQPVSYGDNTKIKTETGWQPEIPLEESLRNILDFWRRIVAAEAR